MAGTANTQRDAGSAWVSGFPFLIKNGGIGATAACTSSSGTSSRTALVGEGNVLMLTNDGDVTIYVAWGSSSIVATTAFFPLLAGTKEPVSIPEGETITHFAGITAAGTSTLVVQRGYGN